MRTIQIIIIEEYTIVHRIIERFSLLVDQFILGFQCDENLLHMHLYILHLEKPL